MRRRRREGDNKRGIKGLVCVSEKKGGPRSVVVALGSAHHRSWWRKRRREKKNENPLQKTECLGKETERERENLRERAKNLRETQMKLD